jgi:hypothetical protein
MRVRSPRALAAGATVLVLLGLAGGATALAQSGSGPSGPSTNGPSSERGLVAGAAGASVTGTRFLADCRLSVPLGGPLRAAADYLGLSVDQLRNELEGGASLAELATEHGKSVDGLEQALIDAAKAELDKRVAAGQITAAEEQHMLSKLRALTDEVVNRKDGVPGPLPKPALGDPIAAAADYLGLSVDQLGEELQDGRSLAEIAKAHGKSVDGLEQAVIDAAKAGLDKSVAAGDLTAAQKQHVLGQLRSQIDDFVNGNGGLSVRIGNGGLQIRIGGPGPASDVALEGPYKTAADYLGLSVDQLTKELQAGKSLADIATEHGKSVDGLKQALVQAETAAIEKSVDALVNEKGLPGPPCAEKVGAAAGVVAPVPGFGLPGLS